MISPDREDRQSMCLKTFRLKEKPGKEGKGATTEMEGKPAESRVPEKKTKEVGVIMCLKCCWESKRTENWPRIC